MTAMYGCYVNDNKEIVSSFKRSTALMYENEAEKYFALLRRTLGGVKGDAPGKHLLDITFATAQVAGSPEHKLLMDLRGEGLDNEETRNAFYEKVIANLDLEASYLILLGTETYDVPFKSKDDTVQNDNSVESFTYVVCAVCPVKQTKAVLHYDPDSKEFQDGNVVAAASAPVLGFMFPAFDNRATNIYNALYYTKSNTDNHEAFVNAVFATAVDKPAQEQKESFTSLLTESLNHDCRMDVVQNVHEQICQQILLHKESKCSETLTLGKEQLTDILAGSGASEQGVASFAAMFDDTYGADAVLYPENILDTKKLEVTTSDVTIRVAADKGDLLQTRVIGGVKYILIRADENVAINGIGIQFEQSDAKME